MIKRIVSKLILLTLLTATIIACKKEVDEPVFETYYVGSLTVTFINTFPVWNVSAEMAFEMTPDGIITIEPGSLVYSGETKVSDDSKITRSGSWQMTPGGSLTSSINDGQTYINIDPNLMVNNDIQRIYAKNDKNEWVLVSEVEYTGTNPSSVLSFSFEFATLDPDGDVKEVNDQYGSITWILKIYSDTSHIPNTPLVP